MIKRKTSVRDRYLTFFEIPSVTTKLVRTRKKRKGDGPVGALISWGLRQLLPAERRKVLDLRWYLGYLLSRWHDLFRSLRHVAATDRIPKFRYGYAVHHVPVSMKINSLHYHVWDIIYATNFPHRNPKGTMQFIELVFIIRITKTYSFITCKKIHSLSTC